MAPIVHGLEANYYDRLNMVYLDIDDPANTPFKQALGYRVQPHFFLLDADGNVLQQWVGSISEAELAAAFDAALVP